jgi:transposase
MGHLLLISNNIKEGRCRRISNNNQEKNPSKEIVIVCDNFNSHEADYTRQIARDSSINLVFLPKYSPDLNPIEYIWKSIKRVISRSFVRDADHMRALIMRFFSRKRFKAKLCRILDRTLSRRR